MTILDATGAPINPPAEPCDHGVTFDEEEAGRILDGWRPSTDVDWVVGNPGTREVRRRWPRLDGVCPKRCGFVGIGYASYTHYVMGDW